MESIDTTELYACRLVVLLETEPQSNVYNQVELDTDKYNAVFATIFDCSEDATTIEIGEERTIALGEDEIKLPDMVEIYEKTQDQK